MSAGLHLTNPVMIWSQNFYMAVKQVIHVQQTFQVTRDRIDDFASEYTEDSLHVLDRATELAAREIKLPPSWKKDSQRHGVQVKIGGNVRLTGRAVFCLENWVSGLTTTGAEPCTHSTAEPILSVSHSQDFPSQSRWYIHTSLSHTIPGRQNMWVDENAAQRQSGVLQVNSWILIDTIISVQCYFFREIWNRLSSWHPKQSIARKVPRLDGGSRQPDAPETFFLRAAVKAIDQSKTPSYVSHYYPINNE